MRPETPVHPSTEVDRAAAVRAALRRLVARQGFHGTSMSEVATEAGVATGTVYVHHSSKDELVLAAYVEEKRALGAAAAAAVDPGAAPRDRFRQLWFGVHRHLGADPDRARFLQQVESSPYAASAHERATASSGDPLLEVAAVPDMAELLVPLPPTVLFDLSIGPVLRLAASGTELDPGGLDTLATSCWRAISR